MKNFTKRIKQFFGTFEPKFDPKKPVVNFEIKEIPFDPAKHMMKPSPGLSWNPMLKFPPNDLCYCRSGLKFKKCCKLKQPLVVENEFAEKATPLVKKVRDQYSKER